MKNNFDDQKETVEVHSSRRRFLKQFAGGVAASAILPSAILANSEILSKISRTKIPILDSTAASGESYWKMVKEQFPLRPGFILMNSANLCPAPYPVSETVFRLQRDVDADASFQNRGKFREMRQKSLIALADYLGTDSDELVITRNTTEGNNMVISGLDLKAGDEVVIWDQNHPTNNVAWDVRAQRFGFTVKRVSTPKSPNSPEDLIQPFKNALTNKTRVLGFSHISNISGVALPAQQICTLARDRGIMTLIDGAQSFGFMNLKLHEIGCDFFTGSAHKWFMGPKEAGILYVRKDRVKDLWPSMVGVGWDQAKDKGANKFSTLGQRDDATVSAMAKAVEFHNHIGKERVEARIRELAASIKTEVQKKIPNAVFRTPLDANLSSGVVVFNIPGMDLRKTFNQLYNEHNIGCATTRGEFAGMRLSPNIYNLLEEVDRVVDTIRNLV